MRIQIVYIDNVDWSDREWECLARSANGEHSQYGYGPSPLAAARRAWAEVKHQIHQAVTKELRG